MTASYYILYNPFYKIEQACSIFCTPIYLFLELVQACSNSRNTYIGILRLLQACTNSETTCIERSEIRT